MGKRGPKPARLKPVAPSNPRRPNPKKGMTPQARNVWLRIVKAYPVDHFKPQHHGLLRAYCEAEAYHDKINNMLKNEDPVIVQGNMVSKANPLIGIRNNEAAIMNSLSVKLGISVNNTTASKGITGSVNKPKSKWDGLVYKDN